MDGAHTERAENRAYVDVNYRMALLPRPRSGGAEWIATLEFGPSGYIRQRSKNNAGQHVSSWPSIVENHRASTGCLRAARENAHAVRGTITYEMWETVNSPG